MLVRNPRNFLLVPALFAIGVLALGWGGRASYLALHNREPIEVTCSDFLQRPPAQEWVRLVECDADYDLIGISTRTTASNDKNSAAISPEILSVYIPLKERHTTAQKARILLHGDSPELCELGTRFLSAERFRTITERFAHGFEGMQQRFFDVSARTKAQIRDLGIDLEDDFVIIEVGAKPRSLWLTLGVFIVGIAALGWVARWAYKVVGSRRIPKATVHTD